MTAAALRALAQRLEAEAASVRALADAIDHAPPAPSAHDLVGPRELGIAARTWRRAIRDGELEATKVGRAYLARRADVEGWLQAHRVEPASASPPRPRLARTSRGDEMDRAIARAHAKRGAA